MHSAFISLAVDAATKALDKGLDSVFKTSDKPDVSDEKKAQLKEDIMASIKADLNQGQIDINKVEAQHKSIFVAGWRPAIGWICAIALAYSFLLQPLVTFLIEVSLQLGSAPGTKEAIQLSALDTGPLLRLVLAMLGLGGFRSFEKWKGVHSNTMKGAQSQTK